MQSLRNLLFLVFVFAAQYCGAQNWQLFPYGQKSIFRDTESLNPKLGGVIVFVADSEWVSGNTRITFLNRKVTGLNCQTPALRSLGSFPPPFQIYELNEVMNMDGIPFSRWAQKGDSISSGGFISRCDSVGVEDVMGMMDSVKTYHVYSLSTGKARNYKLSRTYGLLIYSPAEVFENNPRVSSHISILFGWEKAGVTRGYRSPSFTEYFPYRAGDVLMWQETITNYAPQPYIDNIIFRKDSLTSVFLSSDSVVYIFDRTTYSYKTGGPTYQNQLRKVFYPWKLVSVSGWAAFDHKDAIGRESQSKIWESIETYLIDTATNDTMVTKTFLSEDSFVNDTSCAISMVTDIYEREEYNNQEGLVSYSLGLISQETETRLIGRRKSGVVKGNINLPVSAAEPLANSLKLYPNPVYNTLTVVGVPADATYSILNQQGQVVQLGQLGQGAVSVLGLAQGVYLLRVAASGALWQKRFTRL